MLQEDQKLQTQPRTLEMRKKSDAPTFENGTRVEVLFAQGDRHGIKPKWHGGVVRGQYENIERFTIELDPGVCRRRRSFQDWIRRKDRLQPKDKSHFSKWNKKTIFMLGSVPLSRLRIDASEQPDEYTREKRAEFLNSILRAKKKIYDRECREAFETFLWRPLRMLPITAAFPIGLYMHTKDTHKIYAYQGGLHTTLLIFGGFCFFALWLFITIMSKVAFGDETHPGGVDDIPYLNHVLIMLAILGFYTLGAFSGDIVGFVL